MRSTIVAILLSLTLLLPTPLAPPLKVHAACPVGDVALTVFTLGTLQLFKQGDSVCQAFDETGGADDGCLIGDVGATAKLDGNGLSHGYDYKLADACGDIHVQAGYAFKGGEAQERLEGNGRTIKASWYCSDDPWIYPSGERPTCSRIAISVTGANAEASAVSASQATFPLSASLLAPISRVTLNGQVQNAEKQAKAAASNPAPASKVVTPPQVSPYVVLSVKSNDSPYVEALQYLLRHHDEDVEVDGNFGEQTEAAVRSFQTRKGLIVGGAVDLKSWEALWVTIGIGANGDAVSAAQTLLNVHGFDVALDGDYGEETRRVVRAFQQSKGLIVGGVIDEKIWRALIAPPSRP